MLNKTRPVALIRLKKLAMLIDECKSAAEFAERVGCSRVYLSQILTRSTDSKTGRVREVGNSLARRAEAAFGKPDGWLDTPIDNSPDTAEGIQIEGSVPILSSVQAGAYSDYIETHHDDTEYIHTSTPINTYTFALRVRGDSMEPDFVEGMILIVEPELDAQPNDFVIAKNGGEETTFKQLVKDGADWYLKPLNSRYPIKSLGTSTIVGVVRSVERKFR